MSETVYLHYLCGRCLFFFKFFNFQHLNLFWNSSSTEDEIISYEVKTSGGWEENNKPKRMREDKVIRTGEEISH